MWGWQWAVSIPRMVAVQAQIGAKHCRTSEIRGVAALALQTYIQHKGHHSQPLASAPQPPTCVMARAPASQCRKPASMPRRMGSDSSCAAEERKNMLSMHCPSTRKLARNNGHKPRRTHTCTIKMCQARQGYQSALHAALRSRRSVLTRRPRRSAVASRGSSSVTCWAVAVGRQRGENGGGAVRAGHFPAVCSLLAWPGLLHHAGRLQQASPKHVAWQLKVCQLRTEIQRPHLDDVGNRHAVTRQHQHLAGARLKVAPRLHQPGAVEAA